MTGPRVYVKRDSESSAGRGCVLYGAHFRPEIAKIVWSACVAAGGVSPAIKEVWLTEGWRNARSERDLHKELRAIDITFRMLHDMRPTQAEYSRIVAKMIELLGPDYDVLCHAVGTDMLHVHAELDPH